MLGRWKKFLGVFLAFAMVIAMMPGTALRVSATEESEIDSVTITDIPEIVEGGKIAEANVTVEVPEGFTAVTQWKVWGMVDEESAIYNWTEVTEECFSATDVYYCTVLITADDGFTLPEDWKVNYAEGLPEGDSRFDEEVFVIELGYHTLTKVIDRIEVTASEVAEGNTASVDEILFYSGEEEVTGDVATVDWEWCEYSDEDSEEVTEFEAEKNYQLNIELTAKEGYSFAEDAMLYVNEEEADGIFEWVYGNLFKLYSLLPPVDHVEIELPDVKEGASIFEEVTIGCDCEDCEIDVYWYEIIEESDEDVTGELFVAGKTYKLQLEYNNFSGAALSDDFVFIIDGEEYEPTDLSAETGQAWLELTYEIGQEITPTINITALPTFEKDGVIADANVAFEVTGVPEGSVKAETQWQVWSTVTDEYGDEDEEYVPVTEGTFSDTDVYYCVVVVTADSGYAFSEDYTVKCSEGVTISSWDPEEDNDGNITSVEIEIGQYTLTKVIDKVEVTASEVKAGNTALVDEIVYWSGKEQVAGAQLKSSKWSEESEDGSVNVFESGKNYQLDLELKAKEGYSFANDAELYVNGKKAGAFFYPCHVEACASFSTLPPVEHVEIIDFPEVKEGEPVFTEVTMDCDCEDCELFVEWYDEEDEEVADETFVAGNTYTLQLAYNNFSGAILSDDFVFIIDGEEYEPTDLSAETGQAWLELTYEVEESLSVTVTALPEFKEGGAIADANVTVEVPEGTTAVTCWEVWDTRKIDGEESEAYYEVTEGKFSANEVYYCSVLITAESGYSISDDWTVTFAEGLPECGYCFNYDEDDNITSMEIDIGNYTLTTVIDKVEVTASEVEEGNTASVSKVVCWSGDETIAADNVEITYEWSDEDTEKKVTIFESEKNYQLKVEIVANEGYSFATDVEVSVNGEESSGFGDPCCLSIFESYSLLSSVDHVEITDFPEVKAGEAIFEEVTIDCDCKNCEIDVLWSEITDENEEYVTGVFEAEKMYKLQLAYNNFSGAALSEDFVFIIDGVKYKATEFLSSTQANLELFYAFGKENVNVTAASRALTDDEDNIAKVKIDAEGEISCTLQLPVGSEVTVSVTDKNFINWRNKNGKIVTDKEKYTFIVTGDVKLTMSKKGTAGTALVEFVSEYDQVMKSEIYTPQSTIELPAGPSKLGWNFNKWSLTQEEIKAKIAAGETHIKVSPEYIPSEETYTVKVYVDGKLEETKSVGAADSEAMTVTAPVKSGTKTFRYWQDERGTILGYDTSYSMRVSKDISIYAVYGNETEEKKPVIAMTNVFTTDLGGVQKLSFSVTRDVPEGYTVVEYGMLCNINVSEMASEPTEESFVIGGAGVDKYEGKKFEDNSKGVFTLNVTVRKPAEKIAARGYMNVEKDGKMQTIYSDLVCRSYNE